MIRSVLAVAIFAGFALFATPPVYAEPAVGLQPLQYVETLKKGERKKAFIDVTNPSAQATTVRFNVQAFKQIDDSGTLSFYDDEKIERGVLLDYQEMEIPAKKTLRLFFIVDGTKLPSGDVFAAIFAQTKPEQSAGAPSVRVGTLLVLTNGTPGARKAEIISFTTPLLHVGDAVTGEIKIKNTAPTTTSSGFSPKVHVRLWPFGLNRTMQGPLIFAGNTRTIAINEPSNAFGIYKLSAISGASSKDNWVILVTGFWRWVIPAALGLIIVAFLAYRIELRRRRGMRI